MCRSGSGVDGAELGRIARRGDPGGALTVPGGFPGRDLMLPDGLFAVILIPVA